MATVKLSGLKSNGRVSTVVDTDSALIDGSLTIGDDITEDTLTVNDEFTSSNFSAGEILGISILPTDQTDDVNITVVFLFDWNS